VDDGTSRAKQYKQRRRWNRTSRVPSSSLSNAFDKTFVLLPLLLKFEHIQKQIFSYNLSFFDMEYFLPKYGFFTDLYLPRSEILVIIEWKTSSCCRADINLESRCAGVSSRSLHYQKQQFTGKGHLASESRLPELYA
jgi:hypothetical protein